jgi:hypothetical protein
MTHACCASSGLSLVPEIAEFMFVHAVNRKISGKRTRKRKRGASKKQITVDVVELTDTEVRHDH